MLIEQDNMLSLWASGQSMKFGNSDSKGRSFLEWDYHVDKAIQEQRFQKLQELDKKVSDMQQDMLHRIVDLRPGLWS